MRSTFKLIPIAFFALLLSVAAVGQAEWKGSYTFDENGGRTAGGTAILISHQIDVRDGADGLMAMIESNGYQTSAELICSAKVQGSKLLIYFQNYGENNMFETFAPGDLLLTLEMKPGKPNPTLLTHWGKFTPAIPKNEKSGKVYFRREP